MLEPIHLTTAIVIGAGIAGCSTAYALAKRGIQVTLIERHESTAQEASGNHIATLYPRVSISATAESELALHGFMFTLNLLNQLPNSNQFFNACGQIQLAFNAREVARQTAIYSMPNTLQMQLLSKSSASEQAGIDLTFGGLFYPTAGWVKPANFCAALVDSLNIHLIKSSTALHIEKVATKWLVNNINDQNFSTDVEADIVVICNANNIKQFTNCQSVAITAVRGQLNYFEQNSTSQHIKKLICSTHYLSPSVDNLHVIGATYTPNDFNPQLSLADTHKNLNALREFAPDIYRSIPQKNLNGRVAWRSQTLDYLPLAGQLIDDKRMRATPPRYNASSNNLPWLKGLYINAGHGSKGMTTAPLCGELIASLATNEIPIKKNSLDNLHNNSLNDSINHLLNIPLKSSLISRLNPSRFLLKELGLKQLAASLY